MIDQLRAQIKVVAEARRKATELKNQRDILLGDWNKAHQVLFDALTQAGAGVAVAETRLRELTLQVYAETGNKQPALGVGIREMTKLDYDPQSAFQWAVEHSIALRLDASAFEKIAKASPLAFVKTTTEPQATIATNLDEFVKE